MACPHQALLLITSEGIDELIAQGYPLHSGVSGENLTVAGLDRRDSDRPAIPCGRSSYRANQDARSMRHAECLWPLHETPWTTPR